MFDEPIDPTAKRDPILAGLDEEPEGEPHPLRREGELGQAEQDPDDPTAPIDLAFVRERQRKQLGPGLAAIEAKVCEMVAEAKEACARLGERKRIEKLYERECMVFRNEAHAPIDPRTGEIVKGEIDSEKTEGLTYGASVDSASVLHSNLIEYVLGPESDGGPLNPIGRKAENDTKTAILEEAAKRDFDKAGWQPIMEAALQDVAQHGNGFVRMTWAKELDYAQIDSGAFEERMIHKGLVLEHLDPMDLYWPNPEAKLSAQDFIVIRRRVPLAQMEARERVWSETAKVKLDPATGLYGVQSMPVVAGTYQNVGQLRSGDEMAYSQATQDGDRPDWLNSVSVDPVVEILQLRGHFPVGALIRGGHITLDWLATWDVVLGVEQTELGEVVPMNRTASARLADSIFWFIDIGRTEAGEWVLLDIRPNPYRKKWHEVVHAVFRRDHSRTWGLSPYKLAGDKAEQIDALLNFAFALARRMADPSLLINETAFPSKEDQTKLRNGGVVKIPGSASSDLRAMLMEIEAKFPPEIMGLMNTLVEVHGSTTLSNQASKGAMAQTETDTLGEIDSQRQEQLARYRPVVNGVKHDLIYPIKDFWLECLDLFHDDEELADKMRQVAGELAIDSEAIWPTGESEAGGGRRKLLSEEYRIGRASQPSVRPEIVAKFMDQDVARPLPFLNMEEVYRARNRAMGIPSDKLIVSQKPGLTAQAEIEMVLAGDFPDVDPSVDPIQRVQEHIFYHESLKTALAQAEALGQSHGEVLSGAIPVHAKLIEKYGQAAEALIRQAQQAAAMMQSMGAGGGEGPGMGGENAMAQGIQADAASPKDGTGVPQP